MTPAQSHPLTKINRKTLLTKPTTTQQGAAPDRRERLAVGAWSRMLKCYLNCAAAGELSVGQQRAAWSKAKVKTAFLLNTKLRVLFYLAKATTLGVLAPQSFALSTLLSRCQSVPASTCAPVFVVIRFIRFRRFPRVLFSASTCTRLSHTFSSARLSKVSLVRVLAACYNSNSTVLRLASTCSASLVTTACRRGVPTAAQQGAAPDRLQLHSFRSFLTSFIALPAAGELVVVLRASALFLPALGFLVAVILSREARLFCRVRWSPILHCSCWEYSVVRWFRRSLRLRCS